RFILKSLRNSDLRGSAVKALALILATDSEALEKVSELLDREGHLSGLLESLRICLPEVSRIQEAFLKAMGAMAWRVRRVASQGLGESGTASRDHLVAAMRNRETLEARETFDGCASGAGNLAAEEWVAFWRVALSRSSAVRRGAVVALRHWVDADREIRRAVLERLADEDYRVRQSALFALPGIVGRYEEVRRAVLERLADEDYRVRQSALSALPGIVGRYEEVRRAVLEGLGDEVC